MSPSTRVRLIAAGAFLVLASAGFLLLSLLQESKEERANVLPRVVLMQPRGVLREAPAEFRWEPFAAASRYRLTVSDQDMIWPLALRETAGTFFEFTEMERRAFSAPRRYVWVIEAFPAEGDKPVARGEAYFAIAPAPAAP